MMVFNCNYHWALKKLLLVQIFPLGSLGKSRDKIVTNMSKAWDLVQRSRCIFPMVEERENQVWGWQTGMDNLETWVWILGQAVINRRVLVSHRHSLSFLNCKIRSIILSKAVGRTNNKLQKCTNMRSFIAFSTCKGVSLWEKEQEKTQGQIWVWVSSNSLKLFSTPSGKTAIGPTKVFRRQTPNECFHTIEKTSPDKLTEYLKDRVLGCVSVSPSHQHCSHTGVLVFMCLFVQLGLSI